MHLKRSAILEMIGKILLSFGVSRLVRVPLRRKLLCFGSKAAENSSRVFVFVLNGMNQELLELSVTLLQNSKLLIPKKQPVFSTQQTEMQWTSGTMRRLFVVGF